MPDRAQDQPGRLPAGGRLLLRCLVLAGGVVAAWLLASGVASAAEPDRGPGAAGVEADRLLSATGDALTGLLDPEQVPAELPESTELPALPDLRELDRLDRDPEELPDLDELAGRLAVELPGRVLPDPARWLPVPSAPGEPADQGADRDRDADQLAGASGRPTAAGQPASRDDRTDHGGRAAESRPVPELPADQPVTEFPAPAAPAAPAAPGQPAPGQATGPAADLPGIATTAGLTRLAGRPATGPATPAGTTDRPGTTPD